MNTQSKTCFLIVYDIESNRRRNKVSTLLESYGIRVQKSAFECYLDERRMDSLRKQLQKIAVKEDNIRIYYLNGRYYDACKGTESVTYKTELFIL